MMLLEMFEKASNVPRSCWRLPQPRLDSEGLSYSGFLASIARSGRVGGWNDNSSLFRFVNTAQARMLQNVDAARLQSRKEAQAVTCATLVRIPPLLKTDALRSESDDDTFARDLL